MKAKVKFKWREPGNPRKLLAPLDGEIWRWSENPQVELTCGKFQLALTYDADSQSGGFTIRQPDGARVIVTWTPEKSTVRKTRPNLYPKED